MLEIEEWLSLPDAAPALPTQDEVAGFDRVLPNDSSVTRAVVATRVRDGATLTISAYVLPNEEKACLLMSHAFLSMSKEGSAQLVDDGPAGGAVGQEMRRPWYASADHPRSRRSFAVRDGHSVVILHFWLPFKRDERGDYIRDERGQLADPLVSSEDLKLMENQATLCLAKLTKMGYTSKSIPPRD